MSLSEKLKHYKPPTVATPEQVAEFDDRMRRLDRHNKTLKAYRDMTQKEDIQTICASWKSRERRLEAEYRRTLRGRLTDAVGFLRYVAIPALFFWRKK